MTMSEVEQERRGAPRVGAGGGVPSQLEIDLDTNVLQLSPGGMMVELEVPVAVGSEHRFTLNIEDQDMDLIGVVRNCVPAQPGDASTTYHVGIQFRNLDPRQQEILTRFVESKL
jgi:c-di-GMP-binding flagellar brake protein YcgR